MQEDAQPPSLPIYAQFPAKLSKIFTLLDSMTRGLDMARDYQVSTWGDVDFLVCRSDVRMPGLGTELGRRAVDMQHMRGVRVITAIASSYFSGRIFDKCGFDNVFSIKYDEYTEEGKVIFNTREPHTYVKHYHSFPLFI